MLLLVYTYVSDNKKKYNNSIVTIMWQNVIECAGAMQRAAAPTSHKAHSFEKPFNEFTNSVHLAKSCGSGLLLNISTDPSIIDRSILISYVSIVAMRTYEVGHVRPLSVHIRMYLLVLSSSRVKRNRLSQLALSSFYSDRPHVPSRDREYKEKMELIRETRCMPRHVSRWHTQE